MGELHLGQNPLQGCYLVLLDDAIATEIRKRQNQRRGKI